MANMIYMAYDGDNAGRMIGQAILSNDEQALNEASGRIAHGHEIVAGWVQDHGGKVISSGGDEGTFSVPQEAIQDLEQLRADYQFATQLTMTIGLGSTLSESGKSLMAGKFRGKDQIVQYDPSVDSELSQAQQHVASGSGTEEENKISEAYLNKEEGAEDMALSEHNCKYCQEADAENGSTGDDCQYCQEHDAAKAGDSHCQYCEEADAEASSHEHLGDDCQYCAEADASHEHSGDDCQYCAEADAKSSQQGAGQGDLNEEEIAQIQGIPQSQTEQMAPQASEGNQTTEEVVQELGNEIESDPQQTQSERGVMDQIDPSEMPLGNEMQDNASHQEGYGEDTNPGDMGLSEDEVPSPDLGQVLRGGLDQHADSINREKIVNLIGEALEGFKANKQVLEQAKDQAPQLYSSCLAMLKAMIEMGKMLGLGAPEQPQGQAPAPAQPQPAQPAAPSEGAAQAPQQ